MAQTADAQTLNGEAAPTVRARPRDHLKQVMKIAPYARYVPKNPLMLIGAAAVGLVGVLAWRNRERIAEAAKPIVQSAVERGKALRDKLPFGHDEVEPPREDVLH